MNITSNAKRVFIFFFCLSFVAIAQFNLKFIYHLKSNNLVREHLTYLNQQKNKSEINTDSLFFLFQDFYLSQKNNDSLYFSLKANSKIALSDSLINCELSKYWLSTLDSKQAYFWFDTLNKNPNCNCSKLIEEAFERANQKANKQPLLMDSYFNSYKDLQKAYNKKPLVAAGLSALVPGLGKWYIGKPKVFLLNFLAHFAYASQSYEAIRKLGFKANYTYFILGFGSVFYISNIYGSYNDAKINRLEKKKIYLHEANTFYSDYFSFK